ncbi:hypothetical protein [Gordonia soli]|uniref:DUF1579 domain-containing protein n=1 Tax=Gordonia soli NBRC 108243 TaxID=1223545 RepID=M0QGZ9_9ACTN|nr:hypothetical protein [Gordonia soli]GAC67714.1 hypothetical protein GS4_09_00280 [Gordonia soli NBRC 108243]
MNALGTHLLADEAAPQLDAFSRFNGSWDLEWSRPGDPVAPTSLTGELHFGTVLGGRAIQDVWIVPAGSIRDDEKRFAFHGTTIRFFDDALGAWRSTWVEPIQGRVRKFIGRRVGDEMHLVSTDEDPFLRWRFTEVGPDSFVWLGEYSDDEARTWRLEEKMVATRR